MNSIRIFFVSAFLFLTFNQTYSMQTLGDSPKKTEQTTPQQWITLPELNSNTEELYKQRDSALYSLYIETILKQNSFYKPHEANYSAEEIHQLGTLINIIQPDFETWCKSNYDTKPLYLRQVNYIAAYEGRKFPTASIRHHDVCIDYYTQACDHIPDEKKRIQYFKNNIEIITKALEHMPKPHPISGYQYLIQQAKAGLAIDEFVKANNIPDKRTQEKGYRVLEIEDFNKVILDNESLKDINSENRKAFLRNYLHISNSIAREDRKAYFEKIIKDNLFSNQEFKLDLSV